jgi:hypothetical protein
MLAERRHEKCLLEKRQVMGDRLERAGILELTLDLLQ